MKKLLALLLVLCFAFSLVGCKPKIKNEKVDGGHLVCIVSNDSAEELAPCDIQAYDRVFVED